MITSRDLARLAGVSQSTISRALNDSPLISDDVKARIKLLAKEQRFEMNSNAKSLRTHTTETIGIMFPRFFMNLSKNLYFTYLYDTLQLELSKYQYDLQVIYDSKQPDEISPLERMIKRRKVDGIILVKPDLTSEEMDVLDKSSLPFVKVFCEFDVKDRFQYAINTFKGGFIAGQHYGNFPEYTPLYIESFMDRKDASNRRDGFLSGLQTKDPTIEEVQTIICEMSLPGAYQATLDNKHLFAKKRAVYVYNDLMACGVLLALKDLQIAVPIHVQLISNDDIPMACWMNPQLSTLRFPTIQLITAACENLTTGIKTGNLKEENLHQSPSFIERGTSLRLGQTGIEATTNPF